MIKVICIKKTVSATGRFLKKGEFFYVNEIHLNYYTDDSLRRDLYIRSIPIWDLKNHNNYFIIGYYNSADFLTLDEWREQQIDKILNT